VLIHEANSRDNNEASTNFLYIGNGYGLKSYFNWNSSNRKSLGKFEGLDYVLAYSENRTCFFRKPLFKYLGWFGFYTKANE
jgi:hypothetical protein